MTLFENAYNEVAAIVREFEEHHGEFMAHKYQESEVRTDFIDKFFTALGWDVAHREQTNPREREVKIEKSDTAGSTRRVDYAFYLTPDYRNPDFFCEAKKPSRDLNNADDYFQLVRYGYGASTPVGALTNFDEFHIIDCRYQPHIEKSYPSAQIKVYSYKDYLDKEAFGYIYWLFSREAVEAGKLKEFAKTLPKQQGKGKAKLTAEEAKPVDEAFLTKLEEYRLILAKAFKKADENLNAEVLTEATQKVIDRLVFIRFLEDKYIETDYIVDQIAAKANHRVGRASPPDTHLRDATGRARGTDLRAPTAWKSFISWSKELDVKYNGVVFKPHDIDKPEWHAPDDKVFADLCADISHTHSKYLFTYIPIELLGSIYERFLGKVVTTTAKRAEIEEKPEVRKSGGVYYTPKYIVDYIVANTVGKILDPRVRVGRASSPDSPVAATRAGDVTGRAGGTDLRGLTPKEISKLRFADIACGSGSFLIAVYDTVLHHVEKWYNDNPAEAKKAKCTEIEKGIFVLSLKQKQQILLDNIFGVDIDRQAVEVAQLSLFLKLLESESGATAEQLSFERTKILPDLSKNIQCGNSLVEYDISDLFPLTDEEEKRIKPFSFQSAFREIMSNGGFDAIVGNPPYGMVTEDNLKQYFHNKYFSAEGRYDRFELFIERSLTLIKQHGYFSYIVPTPILSNLYSRRSRRFIYDHSRIAEIVNFGIPVFKDPTVHSCILTLENGKPDFSYDISIKKQVLSPDGLTDSPDFTLSSDSITPNNGHAIDIFVSPAHASIISKMQNGSAELGNSCYIRQCIKTGDDTQYVKNSAARPGKDWKPSLRGRSIGRYLTSEHDLYLKYGNWLARNWKNKSFYETPKIALRETGSRITATLDLENRYFLSSLYAVYFKAKNEPERLKVLLAILNSKLCNFFIQLIAFSLTEGAFTKIRTNQLARFPLPEINPKSDNLQGKLILLVDQMLDAKKRLASATSGTDRERHQKKCEYLDGEIDKLVYALYGLTEEEIKIVEGN